MRIETAICLIMVAWLFYFKIWMGLKAEDISADLKRASAYAVQVHGLPSLREEGAPNEIEIKMHFEKFGKVHCVEIVRDVDKLMDVYQ